MGKSPEFHIPLTPGDKARFMEKAAANATDQNPLWINLRNAQILPWASPDRLTPQRGTFIGVIYENNRPDAVVVDFTRTELINNGIPYARLPLSSIEIREDEVWVDCAKAVDAGVGPAFNFFVPRSEN